MIGSCFCSFGIRLLDLVLGLNTSFMSIQVCLFYPLCVIRNEIRAVVYFIYEFVIFPFISQYI